MSQATDRQARILNLIRQAVADLGYPPTVRELAASLGTSTSVVAKYLAKLETEGKLVRSPHIARGIRLIDPD